MEKCNHCHKRFYGFEARIVREQGMCLNCQKIRGESEGVNK